ncbi:MAG: HAD-IA family hydrolase [Armatimonadota bacterium]|nr:HAD-IA family hydrolase [Armatimonadota bacterium]
MGNRAELPFSKIEWVFTDLGETLIDERIALRDRLEQAVRLMAEIGRPRFLRQLEEACKSAACDYVTKQYDEGLKRLGLNRERRRFVISRTPWRSDLEELMPGAIDLLEILSRKFKLGVIANQPRGVVERLEQRGIRQYFSVVIASEEVGVAKPDPRIFEIALEAAKCPPAKALMIGDRIDNDIRPAKLLGMKTIRVLSGWGSLQEPRDEQDLADYTAESLGEIRDLLAG